MAATVAATMFTGCGGRKKDELVIWWPSGVTMTKIIEDAVKRYSEGHEGFQAKIVYKAMDAFDAYKYALNDDKTRPDVAILDHVYVQALAHDKLLLNLSEKGADGIKADYPAAIYEANCYNGNAYALPFSANTVVLMYNKDILKACGLTDAEGNAQPPATMEELLDACGAISSKGYTAFAQPLDDFSAMEFTSYVARRGGSLVSDDYKRVLLESEEVKSAVTDWKNLSSYVNTASYEEDKFYTGKVAFVEMGSWALSKVTGSSRRFDCGIAEMVKCNTDEENYSGLGLYSLCVAEKSVDQDGAYEFAKFLSTDKQVQLAFNKEKNLFPVTHEALEDEYYTSDPMLSVYARQLKKVAPRPGTPVWPDIEQAVVNMLRSVVLTPPGNDYLSLISRYQQSAQEATDRLFK